jgi:3-oxoacyl-[acyl-carrier-protein] synthase-3
MGTHFPEPIETAADMAGPTGIPEHVLIEKMGIWQRHVSPPGEALTTLAVCAARKALDDAGLSPKDVDLIISHGSEHKDHLIWVAAGKIQHELGAVRAFGFDLSAVCAGGPIAMDVARGMMQTNENLRHVLLVAATREREVINLRNPRSRFMFNFADGAAAVVLRRGQTHNQILGAAAITDGSLAETVVLTEAAASGDSPLIVGDLRGRLDVTDYDFMSQRLADVTLDNFMSVIWDAVEKSGATLADIGFLGITHMKRSFYLQLLDAIGLAPEQSVYQENYGHVQSADQIIALEMGLREGKIKDGTLIVLVGAGAGYTWSAVAVHWGQAS